jgi:hypothetical protein
VRTRVILHVGMPKCGSSALQAALSLCPDLHGPDGTDARYVAIRSEGSVSCGRSLRRIALYASSGALVGARAAQLAQFSERRFALLRARLGWIGRGKRLLMSNEGWGNEYEAFAAGRFLPRLGLEAEVVLYVRPQVEWCNSAWWQWGAWGSREFAVWLERRIPRMQWGDVAQGWRAVPGVVSVRARLLPSSVVGDFCALVGLQPPSEQVVNSSQPGVVLRLLQRHPELRAGQHDAATEFALGRHLRFEGARTPWVMDRSSVSRVIEACRESNERLLEFLEPAQRQAMRSNPAWWSTDAFEARALESTAPQAIEPQELERLAAAAIAALRELDARHRELQRTLSDIRNGRRFPWRLPRLARREPR